MLRSADGDVLRLSIKLINNVGRKKRSNLKTELNYIWDLKERSEKGWEEKCGRDSLEQGHFSKVERRNRNHYHF